MTRRIAFLAVTLACCTVDFGDEALESDEDFAAAGPPRVTHGPLVGAVRPDSATIWLRTNRGADVVVEHASDLDFRDAVRTPARTTRQGRNFTAHVPLAGLPVASSRYYRIRLNGRAEGEIHRFVTAPVSPAAPFTVAVLSDFQADAAPVLETVRGLAPDLLVFLGDLDHRNPPDLAAMRHMHRELLGGQSDFGRDFEEAFVHRRRHIPFLHVWDDHDFGVNNADRTFPGRADALRAFDEFFVKASEESSDPRRGIWQLQPYGAADLFLLDLRSERDPNRAADGPGKSMLGPEQKAWLKDRLAASTRRWKILFSTVPFNPTCKPYDAWGNFLDERQELVDFVRAQGITGVIVVSGDIHSGGAVDDGTNSDFPEISVPHANLVNFVDTFKDEPGTWSGGLLSGSVGQGFVHLEVSEERVVMTVRGRQGGIRSTLTVE